MADICVVGAGLAGLSCARTLTEAGVRVVVLDKGRTVGGRTATRRDRFDHGAARLELGAPELDARRTAWETAGCITRWTPLARGTPLPATWIGVPAATALATHLARDLDVRVQHRAQRLRRDPAGWWVALEGAGEELGPFSSLVLTAPTPQTRELLATAGVTVFEDRLGEVELAPCLAAMVVAKMRARESIEELVVPAGPLAQAHRMDRRPGRTAPPGTQTWVLHGREDWSALHIEDDPETSAQLLAEAFARELPCELVEVRGHRWRYARAVQRIAAPYLLDRAHGIGLAGDWFEAGVRAPAASRALLSGFGLGAALR